MPHQTKDVAVEPSTRDSHQSRNTQRIHAARGSSADPIDLSSPVKTLRQDKYHESTRASLSGPPTGTSLSEERRLIGDYSNPADAVEAPPPGAWFERHSPNMSATRPAIKPKPAANLGLQPVNTLLDDPRIKRKPMTYTKRHQAPRQSIQPTIGRLPGRGQRAYAASNSEQISVRKAGEPTSMREHFAKRRKISHVIDLSGDDSEAPAALAQSEEESLPTSHKVPYSELAKLSKSYPTVCSGSAVANVKRSTIPQSEFQAVDQLTNPRRGRLRRSETKHKNKRQYLSSFGDSEVAGSVRTESHKQIAEKSRSVSEDQLTSTRMQILTELQQKAQAENGEEMATLPHFPNARINESSESNPTNRSHTAVGFSSSHEHHRSVSGDDGIYMSNHTTDQCSPEGLSQESLITVESPVSPARATKQSAKAFGKSADVRKGYPLIFARTYGFISRHPQLRLRQDDAIVYTVFTKDPGSPWRALFRFSLDKINGANYDTAGRIRLEGGLRPAAAGGRYIYDLHFADMAQFVFFRDEQIRPACVPQACRPKDQIWMQSLFDNDLPLKSTTNVSSIKRHDNVAPVSALEQDSHADTGNHSTSSPRRASASVVVSQPSEPHRSMDDTPKSESLVPRASARLNQARANKTVLDVKETAKYESVYKYSEVIGLGPRWNKPLSYGQGRCRGSVVFDDLQRLDEEECLNDNLIEFYITHLFEKYRVDGDKVFFWNTHFYTSLTNNTGGKSINYEAVRKWSAKLDMFSFDYIVVPINDQQHWYVAIICNVSNITRTPVLDLFDNKIDDSRTTIDKSVEHHISTSLSPVLEDRSNSAVFQEALDQRNILDGLMRPQGNSEEDVNLFEEAKLSLVDPDETSQHESSGPDENGGATHQRNSLTTVSADPDADIANDGPVILSHIAKLPLKRKGARKHTAPKRDQHEPVIIVLDSLSLPRTRCVRALKDWLRLEGEARRGMEAIVKENGLYPKGTQIPTQSNWTDCGVYVLGYIEKFFQNPDAFKEKLLAGEMSSRADWPELQPKNMRNNMRNIIQDAAQAQGAARKEEKKAKKRLLKTDTVAPTEKLASSVVDRVLVEPAVPIPPGSTNHETSECIPDVTSPSADATLQSPFHSPCRRALLPTLTSVEQEVENSMDKKLLPRSGSSSTSPLHECSKNRSPQVRIMVKPSSVDPTVPLKPPSSAQAVDESGPSQAYAHMQSGKRYRHTQVDTNDDKSPAAKRRAAAAARQKHVSQKSKITSKYFDDDSSFTNLPMHGQSQNEPLISKRPGCDLNSKLLEPTLTSGSDIGQDLGEEIDKANKELQGHDSSTPINKELPPLPFTVARDAEADPMEICNDSSSLALGVPEVDN